MLTIAQAFSNWNSEIKPLVVAQYGDDDPALSESWNNYTDQLCKDGELSSLAYHYCPSYDDAMPDDDRDFILDAMGLSVSSRRIAARPDGDSTWDAAATHWRVTLKRHGKRMTVTYSMGSAYRSAPDNCDVMNCLLSDASCVDDGFKDWCNNLGYDTDSIKALNMFRACKRTKASLTRLFTASELSDLAELFEDF